MEVKGQLHVRDPRPSTPNLLDEDHFEQHLNLFKQLIRQVAPRANTDEAVVTMLALILGSPT